jgi:hypothetical protein
MTRWLATLVLGTSLLAGTAGAQVFKPKSGSSSSSGSASKATAKTGSSSAKKASTSSKKKTTARRGKKKSSAAAKGRPSDLTPEDAPKVDPDYVKITDDDE